jgi:cation diffusion facilitator CzcD-associated flavoprotein CzcO
VTLLGAAWHWYGRAAGVAGIGVVAGLARLGGLVGPATVGLAGDSPAGLVAAGLAIGTAALLTGAFARRAFGRQVRPRDPRPAPPPAADVRVAVVGAGFAGLGMAIALARQGIRDFAVLERAGAVGGTWRDNTYPGCACDVPSNLYSYSFSPNPDWSRTFSSQPEIHRYLRRCVDRYDLGRHLLLDHDVRSASWDDDHARWRVETSHGELTARVLVCATGPLSEPSTPHLPGIQGFSGTTFHSAAWKHDHDLTGERVAVIGTGASAAQFIPAIAGRVGALYVFQRSAPWVVPRWDRRRSAATRWLFRSAPAVQRLFREAVYYGRESLMLGLKVDRRLLKLAEWLARWQLRRQVGNPALRAALTPDYTIGCKRLIVSNDFYPALTLPHVELVTAPVAGVGPRGIRTADGVRRPVDTIIFGTGFALAGSAIASRLFGRDGRNLGEEWSRGASAYLGMTVHGYPNLFLLTGPNSLLGHNSAILGVEAQINYVLDALRAMRRDGISDVEVRAKAQRAFTAEVQRKLAGTVWMSGCRSWYLDSAGRNTTLWPEFTWSLRRRTRRFDPEPYLLRPNAGRVRDPQPERLRSGALPARRSPLR